MPDAFQELQPQELCFESWFSSGNKEKGDQFEHLMCWWLLNDPASQVEYGFKRVIRWEDWDGRPGPDLGIDLVAWDRDERFWTVQCKAYAADSAPDLSDVARFISAPTGDEEVYGRIFVTSSEGLSKNALQRCDENGVVVAARDVLAQSPVTWPTSEAELFQILNGQKSTSPRAPKSLRPYQAEAVDAVVTGLAAHGRGKLIMACGVGKTVTAQRAQEAFVAQTEGASRVLVLLPSISLLAQTLRSWAAERVDEFESLAVCSDATVADPGSGEYNDMKAVDVGFPATTSVDEIAEFLQRPSEVTQVVFSTYQSSKRVAEAAVLAEVKFSLVVCDEAHRIAGASGKAAGVVLDADFPAATLLFMTATPRVVTTAAKTKAADNGFEVVSMDDETLFGPELFSFTFGEAIAGGYLSDFKVVVSFTTDDDAKAMIDAGTFVDVGGVRTAEELAKTLVTMKAAKAHGLAQMISYHSRISRAADFAKTTKVIAGRGVAGVPSDVHAETVDGTMPACVRVSKLKRLAGTGSEFALLSNAQCLTEGIDVASLDAVAFVDPRQSEVDIVQAVGRAIRKSPDKSAGYVVIPVVCSEAEAVDGKLNAAGHKVLRQVLWALRSHDEAFAAEIDELVLGQR